MYYVYRSISFLIMCWYRLWQLLPNSWLMKLADACPLWPDVFAPRAFFEPMPKVMPSIDQKYLKVSEIFNINAFTKWPLAWMGVESLVRIPIANKVIAIGEVMAVEPRTGDAAWGHDTYYIRMASNAYLNRYNRLMTQSYPNTENDLKVYVPIGSKLPSVSMKVAAAGLQFADGANGWIGLACNDDAWIEMK